MYGKVLVCHKRSWYATTDNGDFYKWGSKYQWSNWNGSTSGSQNVPVKDSSLKWVSKVVSPFNTTSTSYYYGTTWLIAHDNEEDWKNKVNGTIYAWGYDTYAMGVYGVATG